MSFKFPSEYGFTKEEKKWIGKPNREEKYWDMALGAALLGILIGVWCALVVLIN